MSLADGEKVTQARARRLQGSIPSSYTVFKDGSTYYAETNIVGGTPYSGTNPKTIIQNAIDAAGLVFIKDATYSFTGSLNPKSNVWIVGESWNTKLESTDDFLFNWTEATNDVRIANLQLASAEGKSCIEDNGYALRRFIFENLYYNGDGNFCYFNDVEDGVVNNILISAGVAASGVSTGSGINITRGKRITLNNIGVIQCYDDGIALVSGTASLVEKIIISNSWVNGSVLSGSEIGYPLKILGNVKNVEFNNVHVYDSGYKDGFIVDVSGGYTPEFITINGGHYTGNTENGIRVNACNHLKINSPHCNNNTFNGVALQTSNVDNATINGGYYVDNTASGIFLSTASYCLVNGAYLMDNGTYGLNEFGASDNNSIKNCIARGNTTAPYSIVGGSTVVDGKAQNPTPADLTGAAVTHYILHAEEALHLARAVLLYTEATSADAGVTLEIGKESDRDYYYTGASANGAAGRAQWYSETVTLLNNDIAAGDTVTFYSPGGKAGTGKVICILNYLTGA